MFCFYYFSPNQENPEHLDPEVDIEEEEDHGIALPGMHRTICKSYKELM